VGNARYDATRRLVMRRGLPRFVLILVACLSAVLSSCGRLLDDDGSSGAPGQYEVGEIDDLRARRIVFVEEAEAFVVAMPGEEPFALSSNSPDGNRLLFCRSSGWFFAPNDAESYDLHGHGVNTQADGDMTVHPVQVLPSGEVRVDMASQASPPTEMPDHDPSGPSCGAGSDGVVETEPGFAQISGNLVAAEQHPFGIVEGASAGDLIENPGFVGLEIAFPSDLILTRLLAADGSVLHEETSGCDPERCPGYYYADLIFTVDAEQPGTVLVGTVEESSGAVEWFHHAPVILVPDPGVDADSFVGTWYNEQGSPTYFKDESGWHLTLHVINGAEHCGWQSASFLTLAWPLGTDYQGGDDVTRFYVRDPEDVFQGEFDMPPPDLDATLPEGAVDSGFHRGPWHLWLVESEGDEAVYLVSDDGPVERWPRGETTFACA
jgi:hypothetical protein